MTIDPYLKSIITYHFNNATILADAACKLTKEENIDLFSLYAATKGTNMIKYYY